MKKILSLSLLLVSVLCLAQEPVVLDSKAVHGGDVVWQMAQATQVRDAGNVISHRNYDTSSWMEAVVPGTVLNTLVHAGVLPEPYYGINNKPSEELIPDLADVSRDYYTGWFRTAFTLPASYAGKDVWVHIGGINYRSEVWLNGHLIMTTGGMFRDYNVKVTGKLYIGGGENILAVKVLPIDSPGRPTSKNWGAKGEFHNGGDGEIGLNTTMLMSAGWDFTFMDGIRDRNTGIWRSISLYATGPVDLVDPFIRSDLRKPGYDQSRETVSVTVVNPSTGMRPVSCTVRGEIEGEGIRFEKTVSLGRGERQEVVFTPEEYSQLIIDNPRLWWPVNKGDQPLYRLKLSAYVNGALSDTVSTVFGIREITTDRNTPDKSRVFYVNGHRLFIRGENWIPEAMLRMSPERTAAELRYARQGGINLLRLWGGGIEESPLFYELCDRYGILVWQEFWVTGDTQHPADQDMYLANVASSVRRLRNHPSLAYYVASNESNEVSGTRELIERLDGTRGYQVQSECDGVHDGSPYLAVNPMRYYDNTASDRGSRVDGFNPEYGAPCITTAECLREFLDEKDLWPINKSVWDYRDGNAFYGMTGINDELIAQYGPSSGIDEYVRKGHAVGATLYRGIWEVWNYNKLGWGDRWTSGILFWYQNNPLPRISAMMWDWSLEPLPSLYYSMHSLEPLHVQFDYLKNTVSVVNDYLDAFPGCKVKAEVYDLRSRKLATFSATADVPSDGVANDVLTIDFPASVTPVHFIKLYLYDAQGKLVSDNFYWRSTNVYEGPKTLTGPATGGFESLSALPKTTLRSSYKVRRADGKLFVDIDFRGGSKLSFLNRIELLDASGKSIRPSFYTDNWFSLLPGERKQVTVETAETHTTAGVRLRISGWNIPTVEYTIQ